MKLNNKTIVTLLVVGAVGYYLWDRNRKGKSINTFKSFAGDEGAFRRATSFAGADDSEFFNVGGSVSPVRPRVKKLGSLYTAGGYDANHVNPDGTRGATWIGYNQDNTQGYWVKGFVGQGTRM